MAQGVVFMIGLTAKISIGLALCGLVASLGLYAYAQDLKSSNDTLQASLQQAQASRAVQADVSTVLGNALIQQRARTASFAKLHEDLSNVKDDETCRSPTVDRAFDLLQSRRSSR
jgi:hypothetical protein